MNDRNPFEELLYQLAEPIYNTYRFIKSACELMHVREINWGALVLLLPLCGMVAFDLTLGRQPLMPWEGWYESLTFMEALRFYTVLPFALFAAYCLYRLGKNEALN